MRKMILGAAETAMPLLHVREPGQWQARVRMLAAEHGQRAALTVVLLLAASLNLFQLSGEGYGNTYYAAAVKNMLTSWHNFFFAAFDAGFVSVDKPPVGLWIQVASAKAFGFQGWSLMLPQAIAGVLSVALLFLLVRRAMGPVAGLLAALTLALTPISVAVNRHNNLESVLVLTLLAATWAFVLAAETGKLPWLLLGGVLVGLGFNIKMMQAFLILPACYLLYLVAAPGGWRTNVIHLGMATLVVLVVSLLWAAAVDRTPADQRPYVGSSTNNTVIDLIVGHNGLNRLTGKDNDVGDRGPLRLLSEPVVSQIGWLVPLAAVGLAVACWQARPLLPFSRRQHALVLWGTWFIVQGVFFSIAGDWDLHYLSVLAPAVAALVGIGSVALWTAYRSPGWQGWILPVMLTVTAGFQARVLEGYMDWNPWLQPAIIMLTLAAIGGLAMSRLAPRMRGSDVALLAASVGIASLLFAPALWATSTIWYGDETRTPTAGPHPIGDRGASMGFVRDAAPLLSYLQTQQGQRATTYLIASADETFSQYAILHSNEPVIDLAGFSGHDPVLSTTRLATLVNDGAVRFIVLKAAARKRDPNVDWIVRHCNPVVKETWQASSSSIRREGKGSGDTLFECLPPQGPA